MRVSRIDALSEMLRTGNGRRELAGELEAVLFRDALDAHWPATRDAEYGGYLTDLDRRWQPAGEQTKSLEFITRQCRAFAHAARVYPGRGYDEAARQGFDFLTGKMWDAEHGGFFTLVDRRGQPLQQGRKHPHGHLYAIDAFVEIASLVGESTARQWTLRTFNWLEDVAWDSEHGGYWGYYERDNRQILSAGRPRHQHYDWIGTPLGLKDLNVVDDALSTLTALSAMGWDERAASRLEWHVGLILDKLMPLFDTIPYLYTRTWQTAPDIMRAGQCFQLITALLRATAGTKRATDAYAACNAIPAACKTYFAHSDGGFMFANSVYAWPLLGADLSVPERSWWVQNEAARGTLLLSLLQPEDENLRLVFARQWDFIEKRLIDPRFHGFFESAEQGKAARRWHAGNVGLNKTTIWKDVSHEVHLLMDAVVWLRDGPGRC